MTESTLILFALAGIGLIIAWRRGDGSARRSTEAGWSTFKRTLPLLIVAFIIVGYVNALEPQAFVRTWIGPDSGLRGILIGSIAGILLPGGPYVVFPLIATLYSSGAGMGPTLSMITSWAALALLSVSFELPFLGWRFTLIRFGLGLIVPVLVGAGGMLLSG
jgi:uncharacterized membrane protein YraQ (UPF0718 family)